MSDSTFRGRETHRIEPYSEAPLSEYVPILLGGWKTITATTVAVLFIGFLYLLFAHPVYRANALIQVEDRQPSGRTSLGELETIFDTRAKATSDAEMELMQSREVVSEAVRTLHLDVSARPRYFPIVGAWLARRNDSVGLAPPLLGMSRYASGGELIEVTKFDVPKSMLGEDFLLTARDDQTFDLSSPSGKLLGSGRIGAELNVDTSAGGIQLVVNSVVARPGTQFLLTRSSTIATTSDLQVALMISENAKQSGIVSVALDGADPARITETINSIAREYVRENVSRRSAEAERSLAFLDRHLPKLRLDVELAEQQYNDFRNSHGTINLSEEGRLLLQQVVDNRTRTITLEQRKEELLQLFRASDPNVSAVSGQIEILHREADVLSRRVAALPDTEQAALRLSRDVRINTDLYSDLLRSSQQLRVVAAGQVGSVRVVDYAFVPEKPTGPKRSFVMAASAIVGLGIGISLVVLRTAVKGGVEDAGEIERAVGVPVFAVVPHSDTQWRLEQHLRRGWEGEHVLARHAPYDIAVEGVRSIRTALQLSPPDSGNNIVLITGPRPNVGKSFLSVNLGAVWAVGGKRVLIVDADLRRGNLHAYFGVDHSPGFSDVVSGWDIDAAIVRGVMPGVDLMPSGTLPLHPDALLLSDRIQDTLDELSARYDVVIVDTPPVLVATDAVLLAKHAGMTLLVVRHGCQPISETADAIKRLRSGGVAPSGILLTDVPCHQLSYVSSVTKYYGEDGYRRSPGNSARQQFLSNSESTEA